MNGYTLLFIAALGLIFVFSIIYLVALHNEHRGPAFVLKIISTGISVISAFCLFCIFKEQNFWYGLLITLGLCLGLAGDIFIFTPTDKGFLKGMAAFAVGHVLYVAAFWIHFGLNKGIILPLVITVGVVILLMIVLKFEMGDMTKFVIPYCAIIAIMYSFTFLAPVNGGFRTILIIGTTLFVISDFVLAWGKFGKGWKLPPLVNYIGSISYFMGQGFIAWSIYYFS